MRNGRKKRFAQPEFERFNLACIRAADAILWKRYELMEVLVGQTELDDTRITVSDQDGRTVVDMWGRTKGGWICHIVLRVEDAGLYEGFRFEVTLPEHSPDHTMKGHIHYDAETGKRPISID